MLNRRLKALANQIRDKNLRSMVIDLLENPTFELNCKEFSVRWTFRLLVCLIITPTKAVTSSMLLELRVWLWRCVMLWRRFMVVG